ncbi:uncharacterized protein TNCV_3356511 [Trichonephila clavipes]|nr:uncharacterized protein TNCV_3356511 [Trichonephila clavipes]
MAWFNCLACLDTVHGLGPYPNLLHLLEEFVEIDDGNVCTAPIIADKDNLEFVYSSKNIIDTDSDDEKGNEKSCSYPNIIRNEKHHEKAFSPVRFKTTGEGSTRGLLATDHVILNNGQVMWTTPELVPPLLTTTPHQQEDVSALDKFNVHRCPIRYVFSGTGIELVTKKATIRYLYPSATTATLQSWK